MGKPKDKCVSRIALRDISNELKSEPDYWENRIFWVTPEHLNTKETRRLNKELGISGVNHLGNQKGRKK